MCLFYNLLDMTLINCYLLHKTLLKNRNKNKKTEPEQISCSGIFFLQFWNTNRWKKRDGPSSSKQ